MTVITSHAIVYGQYGNPTEVLKSYSYPIDTENLKSDEVVLQTLVSPINPSDLVQILGIYPSKPPISTDTLPNAKTPIAITGNEGLFKIIAKGSDVNDFEIDDWCIPAKVNFGTWCSYKVQSKNNIVKIPKIISSNQAATIAVNPPSAYIMLTNFVELKPGDWFVQNAANSQVGRTAIQIAKSLGINSINIVRRKDNFNDLVDDLKSIGATKVIAEDEINSENFLEWLKGKNVKLGLDCVGGDSALLVAKTLSEDGTLVVYGSMSGKPLPLNAGLFIFKNITVKGFWLTKQIKQDPKLKVESINAVIKLMEQGVIKETNVNETFVKLSEINDDEMLKTFIKAIVDSKNGKQLIKFE